MAKELVALRVGLPRALLFYKYFPLWKTFLQTLGQEVVVSPPTNKPMLAEALELAEGELCVPVKVFYGHVLELRDKVDLLCIPRMVSVEADSYTCPKFLGLPDMIRALPVDLPPIQAPTFNQKLGRRAFYRTVFEWGKTFTPDNIKIMRAWQRAGRAQKQHEKRLLAGETALELIESSEGNRAGASQAKSHWGASLDQSGVRIAVAGHPYNLYDTYLNFDLIGELRRRGAAVETAEMISHSVIRRQAATLPKKLFWTYEKEIVGAAFHWLRSRRVDGIIYLLSFACGPDSLIQVMIEGEARRKERIPLMPLIIDEHTAQAGLLTRVEAFVDMIIRKKSGSEPQLDALT